MQSICPPVVQHNLSTSGGNDLQVKIRILLIDDDRQRLEQTQSLLGKHYIVYSVNNDDEASDFLTHSVENSNEEDEICLIFITVGLDGDHSNGWGFLRKLWTTDKLKDIPVVALVSTSLTNTDNFHCDRSIFSEGIWEVNELVINSSVQ